jgi:hypothetical protein
MANGEISMVKKALTSDNSRPTLASTCSSAVRLDRPKDGIGPPTELSRPDGAPLPAAHATGEALAQALRAGAPILRHGFAGFGFAGIVLVRGGVFFCACGAAGAAGAVGATQLIEPMILAPYWTNPAGLGGECCAVIGR